jgi:hypothetical protein
MNRAQRRASGKPTKVVIDGVDYPVRLLLITGRDEFGRPRECRMIHNDETVEMKDGLAFITVFAHGPSVGKRGS